MTVAGTVTVGCKLPNGLVVQVYGSETTQEPIMGGGWRQVQRAVKVGPAITLNGSAYAIGKPMNRDIRHGAGLTFGVDADLFNAWLEQNKDSDFVTRGMVFAAAKSSDVNAYLREHEQERTGFEPIDPHDIPPEFKRHIKSDKAG